MESTIDFILTAVVVAVALVLVYRLHKLLHRIKEVQNEVELQHYYMKAAEVANEHVGRQQLDQIRTKAELAIKKARHLEGFGAYIHPTLQFIVSRTKLLAEGKLSVEERAEIGRSIENSCAKFTNIIENVLLMARIDSDNIIFNMQVHSLEDIVVPVFDSFSESNPDFYREVENKGDVVLSIGKGIPMQIYCDGEYLKKALTEVMKNAFQFIEAGNIQTGWFYRMMTNEVEIFVEDNGVGISDEHYERIFEPFFKANPSYSGMGIGLTIAQSLVEKMGGKINVTSRGDFGTRISILFQSVKQ